MDSEDEECRPRKRHCITQKNAKVVKKRWNEPPALTYTSVKAELKEKSWSVGIGKLYFNRKDFFRRLISRPNHIIVVSKSGG